MAKHELDGKEGMVIGVDADNRVIVDIDSTGASEYRMQKKPPREATLYRLD